jgi:uncharacterized repeat protein (TIGR03987 family)
MDPVAVIIINLALLFYSVGVWSERFQGRLKVWHTTFFWLGLVCDTWGTGMMFNYVGGMSYDIHGYSGLLAIILMLIHAIWATLVLLRRDEKLIVQPDGAPDDRGCTILEFSFPLVITGRILSSEPPAQG